MDPTDSDSPGVWFWNVETNATTQLPFPVGHHDVEYNPKSNTRHRQDAFLIDSVLNRFFLLEMRTNTKIIPTIETRNTGNAKSMIGKSSFNQ